MYTMRSGEAGAYIVASLRHKQQLLARVADDSLRRRKSVEHNIGEQLRGGE